MEQASDNSHPALPLTHFKNEIRQNLKRLLECVAEQIAIRVVQRMEADSFVQKSDASTKE